MLPSLLVWKNVLINSNLFSLKLYGLKSVAYFKAPFDIKNSIELTQFREVKIPSNGTVSFDV